MFLENQTGRSKQNPFASTLEEGNSQTRFQIAHFLGNGWLRYCKAIGCAAKAPRPGNGQETMQVANPNGVVNHGALATSMCKTV